MSSPAPHTPDGRLSEGSVDSVSIRHCPSCSLTYIRQPLLTGRGEACTPSPLSATRSQVSAHVKSKHLINPFVLSGRWRYTSPLSRLLAPSSESSTDREWATAWNAGAQAQSDVTKNLTPVARVVSPSALIHTQLHPPFFFFLPPPEKLRSLL